MRRYDFSHLSDDYEQHIQQLSLLQKSVKISYVQQKLK